MKAYIVSIVTAFIFAISFQVSAASKQSNWGVDIANDRVEQIRNHLALGEDPNAVDAEGQPAIMQAIQDGAWKVYDLLVRHRNINVNVVNAHDETPLMYLSVIGQTKRAADLIAKGAEVNRLGWTPLHYAASKGHLDTVKLLLSNEAIVNAPSPDGTSPLMMAAYSGSEEVVRALLSAGADATARNLRGEDAADWARRKNHNQLAAQLNDLTDRVLKSRAARAAGSGAAGSANAPAEAHPTDQIHTLDTTKGTLPDAVQRRAQELPPADGSAQGAEDSGSTSRYFDLDRFDRDDGY